MKVLKKPAAAKRSLAPARRHTSKQPVTCPLLDPPKDTSAESVFKVENMIREARRQLEKPEGPIPSVCVMDPDGDVVKELKRRNEAVQNPHWPCYHSELWQAQLGEHLVGFVPFIVGAPYAVLVADELFACGCKLVVHLTSAGEIVPHPQGPSAGQSFFVMVERALRDEGTSVHWQPPSMWSEARAEIFCRLPPSTFNGLKKKVHRGSSWTTDAPFRETQVAIDRAKKLGILCVEMESAALMAYARATNNCIVSFAQVTNSMAVEEGDFEKGDGGGSHDALDLIGATAAAWSASERKR